MPSWVASPRPEVNGTATSKPAALAAWAMFRASACSVCTEKWFQKKVTQ